MIYFLALIPATALTLAGYVVLMLSARAEGSLRTFGRYLGFWAFTLAGLLMLGAIFAAAHGGHRGFGMHARHEHCPWAGERAPSGGAPHAAAAQPPADAPNTPGPRESSPPTPR